MASSNPVLVARSHLAQAHNVKADQAVIEERGRELTYAKVERAILLALDCRYPLTKEQRKAAAKLLTGGAR